jgi:hypothetical protein
LAASVSAFCVDELTRYGRDEVLTYERLYRSRTRWLGTVLTELINALLIKVGVTSWCGTAALAKSVTAPSLRIRWATWVHFTGATRTGVDSSAPTKRPYTSANRPTTPETEGAQA